MGHAQANCFKNFSAPSWPVWTRHPNRTMSQAPAYLWENLRIRSALPSVRCPIDLFMIPFQQMDTYLLFMDTYLLFVSSFVAGLPHLLSARRQLPSAPSTPQGSKAPSLLQFRLKSCVPTTLGNGRNTVSRVLFQKRDLTDFWANSVSSTKKNSASSPWHTNNRLRGTHWVELSWTRWGQKTHWARRFKPYSPKPYSARFRGQIPTPVPKLRRVVHVAF